MPWKSIEGSKYHSLIKHFVSNLELFLIVLIERCCFSVQSVLLFGVIELATLLSTCSRMLYMQPRLTGKACLWWHFCRMILHCFFTKRKSGNVLLSWLLSVLRQFGNEVYGECF